MHPSAEEIRRARFPLARRGYDTATVAAWQAEVASAVQQLQARLKDALRRAERAERAAGGGGDQTEVLETLQLAQRMKETVLDEARAQAGQMVESARAQAAAYEQEAAARREEELGSLTRRRDSLRGDVEALTANAEQQRRTFEAELRAGLGWLDQARRDWPASPPPDAPAPDEEAIAAPTGSWGPPGESEGGSGDNQSGGEASSQDRDAGGGDRASDQPSGENPVTHEGTVVPGRDERGAGSELDFGSPEAEEGRRFHDPFLDELRRAFTEPEPLGPREDPPVLDEEEEDVSEEELWPSRRRRRRPRS